MSKTEVIEPIQSILRLLELLTKGSVSRIVSSMIIAIAALGYIYHTFLPNALVVWLTSPIIQWKFPYILTIVLLLTTVFVASYYLGFWRGKHQSPSDRKSRKELTQLPRQARPLLRRFIDEDSWNIDVSRPEDWETSEAWRLECDMWSILQSRQFVRERKQGGAIIGYSVDNQRVWDFLQKYRKLLS